MQRSLKYGTTLIELIVVMAIIASLFGLATVSLLTVRKRGSINSSMLNLATDIKSQQLKAMAGDTQGESLADNHGVFFGNTQYVLFKGLSYSPSDPLNFVINLDNNLEFTNILFPSSSLVFSQGNGEVVGYTGGANSVTLKDKNSSDSKTIEINRYGAIIANE